MATKKAAKVNAGRPKGAKTTNSSQAEAVATQCPKCGSSSREPYYATITKAIAGVLADGRKYTHVVWRRTRCRDCSQQRVDKTFENKK